MADDYNTRAAKGQALNLAVHQAVHEGKAEDTKYIYSLYLRYYNLSNLVQKASIKDIEQVIKN